MEAGGRDLEPAIREPQSLRDSVTEPGPHASWSLAAALITLSVQAGGDSWVFKNLDGDERSFVEQIEVPAARRLISLRELIQRLQTKGVEVGLGELAEVRREPGDPRLRDVQQLLLADLLGGERRLLSTLAFMLVNISHADDVVRVAAAAALAPLVSDARDDVVVRPLAEGCSSASDTVRQLAANTLADLDPEHPALRALVPRRRGRGTDYGARTSITVHGTWARLRSSWWKPAGRLHSYLLENVSPDLYGASDYFRWEGRYDQAAKSSGAEDLKEWCKKHRIAQLDTVYAHSHGGNVVLDAALDGVRTRLLVLMSVPARKRKRSEWARIEAHVGRMVALRSKLDLVILADRSALRFPVGVRQIPIPGCWFSHGAILQPSTWQEHNLANEIRYEHTMARRTR